MYEGMPNGRVERNSTEYIPPGSNSQSEGVIRARLETGDIIDSIETFLRGGYYQGVREGNQLVYRFVQTGVPKANELGIQSIVGFIQSQFHRHLSQSFFKGDAFKHYRYHIRRTLAQAMFLNRKRWGVHSKEAGFIVDNVVIMVSTLATRAIDGRGLDSISGSTRIVESSTISSEGKKGMFGGKR